MARRCLCGDAGGSDPSMDRRRTWCSLIAHWGGECGQVFLCSALGRGSGRCAFRVSDEWRVRGLYGRKNAVETECPQHSMRCTVVR